MREWTFEAVDEHATARLGAALAAALPAGGTVALIGPLGAGKTRLVQAAATADGVDPRDVVSPTFVLLHEYQSARPIYHFDLYRITSEEEFRELGAEEYFTADGLVFIEWAEKASGCLPIERLDVRIEVTGAEARWFELRAIGEVYEAALTLIAVEMERRGDQFADTV